MSAQTQKAMFMNNLKFQKTETESSTNETPHSRRISTQQPVRQLTDVFNLQRKQFDRTEFPSIQSRQNRIKRLSQALPSAIQKLIQQEIAKGHITLPQRHLQYGINKKKKPVQQKPIDPELQMKQKIIEMQMKRLSTVQQLKLIGEEEAQLRKQSVTMRYRNQSLDRSRVTKERSHYSPEEKRQVKKMVIRQKMLEHQLNQKTQNFKQRYYMSIQTQRQRHVTQIQKEKSLHRSFIQENKKIVEVKKVTRFNEIENGNKQYQQVKSKRYFHQLMREKDEQTELKQLEEFNKKLNEIKAKMKVTIVQEVREHQDKYEEIKKSRTAAQSIKNSHYFSQNNSSSQIKKFEQNFFTKLTKAERQMKKKEELMARSKVFELKEKAKVFAQRCSTQIRPNIKITTQSKFNPIESHRSVHSLNYFQQQKKGHEYLSVAKKLKKCQTLEEQKVINNKVLQNVQNGPQIIRYKNYLTQVTQNRRMSQSCNSQNDRRKFSTFLEKQGNISEYNSLHKAFIVAETIQAKSKKSKNQKLIDAVQNKIQLLKMIV